MANSTIELRHLLRTNFQLFDFDYPFDDLTFKKELEQHVIDYFYSYEIGQETPDMFKQKFKSRWLRMIGYYNELYNTTLLSYNPLSNYTVSELSNQLSKSSNKQNSSNTTNGNSETSGTDSITGEQTSANNGTSTSNTNTKTSDYPQQAIAGGSFASGESVTKTDGTTSDKGTSTHTQANKNQSSSKDSTTSTGSQSGENTATTDYQKTIEGMTGTTYQELVRQQRENILKIPIMVCNEMKPCFMMVY